MRAASLRVGGQGVLSTVDDHLLIVGDAAGHIDPLTGGRLGSWDRLLLAWDSRR